MENKELKKAVAYLRVSTEKQATEEKYGLDAQKQAIDQYAKEHGYDIVEYFTDTISGVKDRRPNWDKIILAEDLKNPPFEAVIVFKSDRVSRKIDQYFYFFYKLQLKGVELISVEEDFGVDNAYSSIIRSFVLFSAEQERANITLRTSNGRKIKAFKGGYSGGKPPYGYTSVNHKLVVVKEEAKVIKFIFEMLADNASLNLIARDLNRKGITNRKGTLWTASHIFHIKDNEKVYRGYYKYGSDEWVKGQHEPILGE